MKYNLNDRFILSSDSHNWILIDKNKGRNNQNNYFANLNQLSNFITETKAKECLTRCDISLCNKSATSPSYHSVVNSIVRELEVYFKEITNNERN